MRIAGFRPQRIFLVTTLLDPVAFPAAQLAELSWRRWRGGAGQNRYLFELPLIFCWKMSSNYTILRHEQIS